MSELEISQPEGHPTIHVFEVDGGTWACCAYDHGPFCRLCQPVDETMLALITHVADGNMVARAGSTGEFEFKAAAEDLVHNNAEMAQMWAQLEARGHK